MLPAHGAPMSRLFLKVTRQHIVSRLDYNVLDTGYNWVVSVFQMYETNDIGNQLMKFAGKKPLRLFTIVSAVSAPTFLMAYNMTGDAVCDIAGRYGYCGSRGDSRRIRVESQYPDQEC